MASIGSGAKKLVINGVTYRPDANGCVVLPAGSIGGGSEVGGGVITDDGAGTVMIDVTGIDGVATATTISLIPDPADPDAPATLTIGGVECPIVKDVPCIIEADAGGQEWDADNPAWIDPATVDKYCELRLDNGITGCEVWRRLEDVLQGAPQWQQVA